MREKYVIACDLGTSGVKIVAFGADSRTVLNSASETYPLYVDGKKAEQDPQEFWEAICRGMNRIRQSGVPAEDCLGIVFGTQWRGMIPIDKDGRVLRRAIIWMDKRAKEEAALLNDAMGQDLFCEMDYWPKLMWFLKNEPEIFRNTAFILEVNAYLKWKATGRLYSDITNNYTRSYNGERDTFYGTILRKAGLDRNLFPPLCEPSDRVGGLTAGAAGELGLPEGLPVFGGCCDIPALAIGSGCSRPGDVHAYLGTSGWLGHVEPVRPDSTYTPSLDRAYDVGFYAMGVSVGPSTEWMLNSFFREEKEKHGKAVWDRLDRELDGIPAGSGRLLAAPWFFGSRPPFASGNARGVFVNLDSSHTPAHMLKAVFEGSCYILRQNLELLNSRRTEPAGAITACGGGALNRHWMQAMADILKTEIRVPEDPQNTGSIGVAYCALVGLGIAEDFGKIASQIRYARIFRPREETFAEYDLLYREFTRLHDNLHKTFDALNG